MLRTIVMALAVLTGGGVAHAQVATGTISGFIPQSGSSGFGASLVQSTTLVASGSPEATPRENGSAAKVTLRSSALARVVSEGRAASAAP